MCNVIRMWWAALAVVVAAGSAFAGGNGAATDTADAVLMKAFEFSLSDYSSEGAGVELYINAKTKDSVIIATYYGSMGKVEYTFVFNKKLIDAEKVDYDYDGQKYVELGRYEVALVTKASLKTSEKKAKELTAAFLEIRGELSKEILKKAAVRQGFEYLDKGDNERKPSYYDSAIVEFNRAMRSDSLNEDVFLGRGRAYLRKGDNRRAVADFSIAIRLNPNNEITFSNRGRAYARMGDYDKAVADFEEAAKIDPSNKLIKQNLERAKRREKGL